LVMMAMLFTLEERRLHQQTRPLLSGTEATHLRRDSLPLSPSRLIMPEKR
jgi:hypothetical protein